MSKTILITGGAASGKTRWAVSYLAACDNVLYLCTNDKIDDDTNKRIEYNNKHNYVEWDLRTSITEAPAALFEGHKFVIFDSLASYASKTIAKMCPDHSMIDSAKQKEIEKKIIDDITEMYDTIMVMDGNLIVLTVETGFSVTPENPEQRIFREIIGNVNQRIANMSNEVYLSASGIQFKIK